ncbi:MAG: secondary thiamine-phosphate synthase enzyme YjbQ [Cyanobacteria bacterium P01_G01_bin.54]
MQQLLNVQTQPKRLHNITQQVESVVAQAGVETGLCTVFVRHTSASLIIQENADPDVLRDLNHFFAKLVPQDGYSYIHDAEGPDDMPAHIRSAITRTSEQIPIAKGRLVLGTWQGIYLWEHRDFSHRRQVVIHVS